MRMWARGCCRLVLGLSLLAVMRICAFYDPLADPLAWTVLAAACLGWALSERRPLVRLGFLWVAGPFALAAVDHWLTFAQMPRAAHGLVIVAVGALSLVLPQGVRNSAGTRMISEGLSVTWVLAGTALADSSPSDRALELTVAGVAAGITAYLSEDRRRAGWASGVLLTFASWIRLMDNNIEIGGGLLGMGMTWESRVNDVRTAGRYVRGLR